MSVTERKVCPFANSWKFKKLNAACLVDKRHVFFRLYLYVHGASQIRGSSSKLFTESRRPLYYVARVQFHSSYVLVNWSNAQQYQQHTPLAD